MNFLIILGITGIILLLLSELSWAILFHTNWGRARLLRAIKREASILKKTSVERGMNGELTINGIGYPSPPAILGPMMMPTKEQDAKLKRVVESLNKLP